MGYTVRLAPDIGAQLGDARNSIKNAFSTALTKTAKDAVPALYAQMRSDFDVPTPYSLDSLYVKPSTGESLAAEVLPKTDASNSGSPADKYLAPEIYGGDRKLKRLELRLQSMGIMKPGQYAVPGKGASLDAYGNISRGQIERLLVQLGAMREFTTNAISKANLRRLRKVNLAVGRGFGAKRRTLDTQYFVAKSKTTGDPLGVYVLLSRGNVQPVLVFVKKPIYTKRLHWGEVADRVARERFPVHFNQAMEQAIARAEARGQPLSAGDLALAGRLTR